MVVLHARRKHQDELARREAAGESFWNESFASDFRVRLLALTEFCAAQARISVALRVADTFRAQLGIDLLKDHYQDEWSGLKKMILAGCPDPLVPSLIEATFEALSIRGVRSANDFPTALNHFLNEHRISYELIEGEMVERASQELHAEVVAPVLLLLSHRSGFEKVEAAYQDALREISAGHPADAITDAGTALQETLTTLGCRGNALGPLIADAQRNGLLAAHDSTLGEGIAKILKWVSADRSNKGDSHRASTPTTEDAWLAVHVVGALILRLVQGGTRA